MSFISILFVSFLLSGSAKISDGGKSLAVDSPLTVVTKENYSPAACWDMPK